MSGVRVGAKGIRVDVSVGELTANDECVLMKKVDESSMYRGPPGGRRFERRGNTHTDNIPLSLCAEEEEKLP